MPGNREERSRPGAQWRPHLFSRSPAQRAPAWDHLASSADLGVHKSLLSAIRGQGFPTGALNQAVRTQPTASLLRPEPKPGVCASGNKLGSS